jgi:uncharacterized SAM-dependent methyltransferase
LVGIDGRNPPCVISKAYNDSDGLTNEFIMNGLDNINKVFGMKVFERSKFEYLSIYNDILGRHEAYYKSLCDQVISSGVDSVEIKKDELINIEYSFKYVCSILTKDIQKKKPWISRSNQSFRI